MNRKKTHYSIITPDRVFAEGQAELIVTPGVSGDFGVLIGMSPLISELRAGAVVLFDQDIVTRRIYVNGGVAEVSPVGVNILTPEAENFADIDVFQLQVSLKHATENQQKILLQKQYLLQNLPYQ